MQQFFPSFRALNARCLIAVVQLLPCLVLAQGAPIDFTVPNGLENVEGNDSSLLPFGVEGSVRYQQVYDASQFSRLPPGGAFLDVIFFRNDCKNGYAVLVTNLQV